MGGFEVFGCENADCFGVATGDLGDTRLVLVRKKNINSKKEMNHPPIS